MSAARISFKLGQVKTRINQSLAKTVNGAVTPQDLSALRLEVVLSKAAVTRRLTEGAGVTVTDAAAGKFAYDVAAGDLDALLGPAVAGEVSVFTTIYNADDSVFGEVSQSVSVSL